MHATATKWVMLRNLPWALTQQQLLSHLRTKTPYIQSVQLKVTREGRNRGLGFAAFSSEEERQMALAALKNLTIESRRVTVLECADSVQVDAPKRVYRQQPAVFKVTQPANHDEDYYP